MQLPHKLPCVVDFFVVFYTVLTALVDRPIEDMLSAIAMYVWHTASTSAVIASILLCSQ